MKLGKLRRLRNAADYHLDGNSLGEQECEAVLMRSQEILDLCQEVVQKVAEAKG